MKPRLLSLLGIILAVFLLPWWLSLLAALLCLYFFNKFYELLIPAFLFDLLYTSPSQNYLLWPAILLTLVLIFLSGLAKRYLRYGV